MTTEPLTTEALTAHIALIQRRVVSCCGDTDDPCQTCQMRIGVVAALSELLARRCS